MPVQRSASSFLALRALIAVALLSVAAARLQAEVMPEETPVVRFAQAENEKLTNHPRFLGLLRQLQRQEGELPSAQRWHLRYLEAWEAAYAGDLPKASAILRDIINQSGDEIFTTRASALLINVLSRDRQYETAYELANTLMVNLPRIAEEDVRGEALRAIIQMLGLAGQNDQALKYARQLESEIPPGKSRCAAYSYELNALDAAGKLSPKNPGLQRAIDMCLDEKQEVYANTLRLDLASLLTDEGRTDKAISLLQNMSPSILKSKFQPHIASLHIGLAEAYMHRGDDASAKKAALAALAVSNPQNFSEPLQSAYSVLYFVEKRAGHPAAALSYYEKYVTQKLAAMDDTKTRALAYQMVRQQVVDKKLKLEALDKQNGILELRQALASKAQEASRLYIVLLSLVIVFIGLWTFRLKQSQMRFRRMARHDGLTGAFNRQHFLHEAGRILQRMLHADDAGACLVVLDLDHFKRINDTYGHAAGDEALRRIVAMCRRELRDSDLFGRLGGEEFGILMPGCTCEQGVEIATRIRRALASAPLKLSPDSSVVVSASLGLAHSTVSGYAFHQLFSDADAALYKAKRGGRNRLVVDTGGDAPLVMKDDAWDAASA